MESFSSKLLVEVIKLSTARRFLSSPSLLIWGHRTPALSLVTAVSLGGRDILNI